MTFLFVLARQCLQGRHCLSGKSYVKKRWHSGIPITVESMDLLQEKLVENITKTIEIPTDISYYCKYSFKVN